MTLGLYLIRRLGLTFAMITSVFLGMLLLFEVVEMMRRFGGSDASIGDILWLSMLHVPETLYQIMPLIMILAAMTAFLGLARSSELVVIRGAGRSAVRMLREPFVAALVFGLILVALINPLVAAASRAYQTQLQALQTPGQFTQISLDGDAIWLRQGDQQGQTVIRAQSVEPQELIFQTVTVMQFDRESGLPLVRIEAQSAQLDAGQWRLNAAKRWDLQSANPEQTALTYDQLELASDLTNTQLQDNFEQPGTLSVWHMPSFIAALDRAGLSSRNHRVQFHSELALPILLGAMFMVGSVLSFRHARAGSASLRILITVLAGFALFFLRNFAQVLGENGQIPLLLAVWTPPIASMLLALGVFLHLEDG